MKNYITLLVCERQTLINQILSGQAKFETVASQILEINNKIKDCQTVIK